METDPVPNAGQSNSDCYTSSSEAFTVFLGQMPGFFQRSLQNKTEYKTL
jgi:hypothetical protein